MCPFVSFLACLFIFISHHVDALLRFINLNREKLGEMRKFFFLWLYLRSEKKLVLSLQSMIALRIHNTGERRFLGELKVSLMSKECGEDGDAF